MIVSIQALLSSPNPDDPLDEDRRLHWNGWPVGSNEEHKDDVSSPEPCESYCAEVRRWKELYAMGRNEEADADDGSDNDEDSDY